MGTIRIGRIVGAQGLKGEVKVEPLTDFFERFDPGKVLTIQGAEHEILGARLQGERLVLQIEGVSDRTAAEKLQWEYLEADEDLDVELDEDEYFTADLIGMRVVTEAGEVLGEVEKVLPYPAHDLLVVDGIMIPAVKEFVKQVDLKGRRMVVHLIEGMR
ncbi:MAG: 16S rRNA processing protein RimM [Armatimonadetes bacterium]|nr:16S rRNA processing protein RimM [Armatimonadota bacterium]